MYVLVTYTDEVNQMKNEGVRVVTTLYSYILDAQGQLVIECGCNSNSFETFMGVMGITCKNEEGPFKIQGARVVTTDLPL